MQKGEEWYDLWHWTSSTIRWLNMPGRNDHHWTFITIVTSKRVVYIVIFKVTHASIHTALFPSQLRHETMPLSSICSDAYLTVKRSFLYVVLTLPPGYEFGHANTRIMTAISPNQQKYSYSTHRCQHDPSL